MAAKRSARPKQPPAPNDAPGGRGLREDKARKASAKRRRRKRHGNYILYYILLVLLLIGTGVILSLTVFFKIETITVTGTDKYPNSELVEHTGVTVGENLFRIDTAAIEARMKEYPYVESVTVRRNYPPEVVVAITEAQPMAAVEMNEGYTVISAAGRILETGLQSPPASLPLVVGLRMPGRAGEMVGEEAQEGLNTLRYLTQAMADVGFAPALAIDLSDRLNIVLIYNEKVTIELGVESDLDRKLRLAAEVMENQLPSIYPDFRGVLYADVVGKVWADPVDEDYSQLVNLEGYVFDEQTQTFVKKPEEGEIPGESSLQEETSTPERKDGEEEQDIVD